MRCRLSPTYRAKWEFMDLPIYNFNGYHCREALAAENKIVYFGANCENATFVLEQEGESEQLKVVREDDGFNLMREFYNTASCVFMNQIYAFKTGNYEEVYRYSLECGKWSRFSSQE